jgi:DNA repair exonuclease SbcCD ATPase subunit
LKVCHIADIHWRGLKRHGEYREVFSHLLADAKSQRVDRIVVAGDIVHTKTMGISPELIKQLTWWFTALAEVAPTIVTLGNHDGLILNKSRLDTITPIIETLNNDRIVYLRDTCQWTDKEFNTVWTNFSCFDEENWHSVSPISGKLNICLFHGAIKKAKTDVGWEVEGERDMSLFQGYDFGMFGDIHKFQYLDEHERFAYPGSTIQQDFAEDIEKGYLLWNIKSRDEYSSVRRIVPSPNPFYNVDWEGTPDLTFGSCEKFSKNCRIRIVSNESISQDDIKKFSFLVKSSLFPEEIAWKINELPPPSNIVIGENNIEKASLRDEKFHFDALREFCGKNKLSDEEWDSVDSIVSSVIHSFESIENNRNTKWSIKSLEWDNTFSYGKGNKIDFSSLEGIIGLFGTNRCGKSSIPGTIMYALFNDTDRGSISNLHVINARKGDCEVKVEFELNGNHYKVERMSHKWSNSRGLGANTKMNLFRIDESGDIIEDISGEQRRDSDKALRQLIGESEDFLLTSFASQGEMNMFIKNGATDRKKLLNNFLDLGIFEQILVKLKEDSHNIKSSLKVGANINYDVAIADCEDKILQLNIEKKALEKKISDYKDKEINLRINLATVKKQSGYTQSDVEVKKKELSTLQKLVQNYDAKIEEIEEKIELSNVRLEKIKTFKNSVSVEVLREELNSLRLFELNEAKLSAELEKEKEKLRQQELSVSKLRDVPCGDQFPTCKFIRDSHRDKTLIESQRQVIEGLSQKLQEANDTIADIKSKSLETKIEKYERILREEINLSSNFSSLHVEKNSYASKSLETIKKIKEIEEKIIEMQLNLVGDETENLIFETEEELRKVSVALRDSEASLLRTERSIGSETSSLQKNQKDKEEYSKNSRLWKLYELLIQAYGKNGLQQVVLTQQLPRINQEISSILQGVCGFTVGLVSNGNDLEINLDYGDSQRPIELGSGMEKMMASLAIRVALINVSSLPKTDMLIIDEGFGALDEVNVEACNRLLVSLKRFFKTIIVISHVDAVKDAVDNIIEITKQGPDSYVWA